MSESPKPFSFNLVTEPWIPCVRHDGKRVTRSLEETLSQAHELREIHDDSPLVTVTLHRLLLAILHHIFGPEDAAAWSELWQGGRGHFDPGKVHNYFRDPAHPKRFSRFDLFDSDRPFYQTTDMNLVREVTNEKGESKPQQYRKTVAKLAIELAQNATLFHHELEELPTPISPAEAARLLLSRHGFSTENIATAENEKGTEFVTASPLVKGAVALVVGDSLFQTLLLNLHQYSNDHGQPFAVLSDGDDLPAWDRPDAATRNNRQPVGYLDLLTWQSRRIRLLPDRDDGIQAVRFVVIMKGEQLDDFDRHGRETMVGFQKNERAKTSEEPWLPVRFDEAKSLWRNSHTLFDTFLVDGKRPAPKTIQWLLELRDLGMIETRRLFALHLFGLDSYTATVLYWRHECLPLPVKILGDQAALGTIRVAVTNAEEVHGALIAGVKVFAELVLFHEIKKLRSQPQKKDIDNLLRSSNADRAYWTALEIEFQHFLRKLPDCADEPDPALARERLVLNWCDTLRHTASRAFYETVGREDASAREHKAFVGAEQTFQTLLKRKLPDTA